MVSWAGVFLGKRIDKGVCRIGRMPRFGGRREFVQALPEAFARGRMGDVADRQTYKILDE